MCLFFSFLTQWKTAKKVMRHVKALYRKKKIRESKIDIDFQFCFELKWTNNPRTPPPPTPPFVFIGRKNLQKIFLLEPKFLQFNNNIKGVIHG